MIWKLTDPFVVTLRKSMGAYRFTFNDEAGLQDQLEEFFRAELYTFEREKALGPRDRPDFLVQVPRAGVAAIEVKVQGSIDGHLRQMKRYCAHDSICCVVLVCVKPWEIPDRILGKPSYRIGLWKQLRLS